MAVVLVAPNPMELFCPL